MTPKYEVGEVVLLRSRNFPECDGEYTVTEVAPSFFVGFKYMLDIKHSAEGWEDYWAESSLRKKHQPGEMGFKDLMASLVAPKLLTHQPSGVVTL